jgi:cytochrome b6-f complex iron-sulfur subunit
MIEIRAGQLRLRADHSDWIDVVDADTAAAGRPCRFTTAELVGYLTVAGGVVVAVVGVCSRCGCLLRVDGSAGWLRCPAAGAVYRPDGRLVEPGGHYRPPPLPLLQSRQAGGRLQALVPRSAGAI